MADILYHDNLCVGDLNFEIVFEKVNPWTHKLNCAISRIYFNGELDDVYWYASKDEYLRQIETAKLIDNYIRSINYYRLNQEELDYMSPMDNDFSLLGRNFYYDSEFSFKKYVETGQLKRTNNDFVDINCLLGNDPNLRYNTVFFYNEDKHQVEISFRRYTENGVKEGQKNFKVKPYFKKCLDITFIIDILYDVTNQWHSDVFYAGKFHKYNLYKLITIPYPVGGIFGEQKIKFAKKHHLFHL